MTLAQSNVDYITEALNSSPELHLMEVTEERYESEGLGERPAMYLAHPEDAFWISMLAWFYRADEEFRREVEGLEAGA